MSGSSTRTSIETNTGSLPVWLLLDAGLLLVDTYKDTCSNVPQCSLLSDWCLREMDANLASQPAHSQPPLVHGSSADAVVTPHHVECSSLLTNSDPKQTEWAWHPKGQMPNYSDQLQQLCWQTAFPNKANWIAGRRWPDFLNGVATQVSLQFALGWRPRPATSRKLKWPAFSSSCSGQLSSSSFWIHESIIYQSEPGSVKLLWH